ELVGYGNRGILTWTCFRDSRNLDLETFRRTCSVRSFIPQEKRVQHQRLLNTYSNLTNTGTETGLKFKTTRLPTWYE
mgnify:CR=1